MIDEIDQAAIEFPNDLLQELDRMEFCCFETGETIQGNISSGEASIVTSANSRITVNNLEQAYVEDELITGESGTIRTVFKTILAP